MAPSVDHYTRLQVPPHASDRDIRQAYRELSKQYHPDTTTLPLDTALREFQQLQEAYAILGDPDRRRLYDRQQAQARIAAAQVAFKTSAPLARRSRSSLPDPQERSLSAGEIFALFLLSLTVVGCLVLAVGLGLVRGEKLLQAPSWLQVTTTPAEIAQDDSPAELEAIATDAAPISPDLNDNLTQS